MRLFKKRPEVNYAEMQAQSDAESKNRMDELLRGIEERKAKLKAEWDVLPLFVDREKLSCPICKSDHTSQHLRYHDIFPKPFLVTGDYNLLDIMRQAVNQIKIKAPTLTVRCSICQYEQDYKVVREDFPEVNAEVPNDNG